MRMILVIVRSFNLLALIPLFAAYTGPVLLSFIFLLLLYFELFLKSGNFKLSWLHDDAIYFRRGTIIMDIRVVFFLILSFWYDIFIKFGMPGEAVRFPEISVGSIFSFLNKAKVFFENWKICFVHVYWLLPTLLC